MSHIDETSVARTPLPEFAPEASPSPRFSACELFRGLVVAPEERPDMLQPAFEFALGALAAVSFPAATPERGALGEHALDDLIAWATDDASRRVPEEVSPARAAWIAREFAPLGLTDGAWLVGSVMANAIESEVGMSLLAQLMLRFGDPGLTDSHARRYEALLRSLGSSPDGLLEGWDEQAACLEVSYRHALLGLSLGRFPTALGLEMLGLNLWMSAVGPCPLLARLLVPLSRREACVRYFRDTDREPLRRLARRGLKHALDGADAERALERIRRGFLAAHAGYSSWAQAMCEHGEQVGRRSDTSAVAEGASTCAPPEAAARLQQFALDRYATLPNPALYHRFANADCYPAVSSFGQLFVTRALQRLSDALDTDERLSSMTPPPYSERLVAEMVAANHDKNVATRSKPNAATAPGSGEAAPSQAPEEDDDKYIGALFDGCWLQGFADLRRTGFEEYGWLFRIYASEHGDGDLSWNHSRIFNLAFAERGLEVTWPKTDERLYQLFDVAVGSVAKLAIALHTRHFMPEILGMNLGIEASGVGGSFIDTWKSAEGKGRKWQALAARLHNSIDNYADGHTKWSLSAVQSFMRRVKDAAPDELQPTWHRLWRLWRVQEILAHGSQAERDALAEHLDLRSLVPA
jgi:hypothetical protein